MIINKPALDFLTITSYEWTSSQFFEESLPENMEWGDKSIMQYQGVMANAPEGLGGSVFMGVAEQAKGMHHMYRFSGEMAEFIKSQAMSASRGRWARATRLDIQATVKLYATEDSPTWNQSTFCRRMRKKFKSVALIRSEGMNGWDAETVYIGSRSSDRYVRVYIKFDGDGMPYLRFEVELKGDRANNALKMMADGIPEGGLLLAEVQRLGDIKLERMFAEVLLGISPSKVAVKRPMTNTRK